MSTVKTHIAITIAAMAGSIPAHAATKAGSQQGGSQNVIMVLDSSGSMAGRINGVRKIDIARDAVRSIVGSLDPKVNLGLIAYGHRRKGDCSDIQTIHRLGSSDRAAMSRAIQGLKPVGKTPLSDAVRAAAEQMKFTEE